jgi:hypothetical protein
VGEGPKSKLKLMSSPLIILWCKEPRTHSDSHSDHNLITYESNSNFEKSPHAPLCAVPVPFPSLASCYISLKELGKF